jgi:hypothetical protein
MTTSWLLGVFVFAILIGDIKDIVNNVVKSQQEFQNQLDKIIAYMNKNKLSRNVQDRVKMWLNYTWRTQKSFDETQETIDKEKALLANCNSF